MPITEERFEGIKEKLRSNAEQTAKKFYPIFQRMEYTWGNDFLTLPYIPTIDDICLEILHCISKLKYNEKSHYWNVSTGRLEVSVSVYEYEFENESFIEGNIKMVAEETTVI